MSLVACGSSRHPSLFLTVTKTRSGPLQRFANWPEALYVSLTQRLAMLTRGPGRFQQHAVCSPGNFSLGSQCHWHRCIVPSLVDRECKQHGKQVRGIRLPAKCGLPGKGWLPLPATTPGLATKFSENVSMPKRDQSDFIGPTG